MSVPPREPRNPLYLLLLIVGLVFVVTALAYALIPVLEERAAAAGNPPTPSSFRDALMKQGGWWLLAELAVLVVVGAASMVLDRLRSLKKEKEAATITPTKTEETSH
jgi:hypothetical protein